MNERSRFASDLSRRLATIDGQLRGIERLVQKGDVPQAITQSAAVRNAIESLVRIVLQASIIGRFAKVPVGEAPEDIFERALERAMTYWSYPHAGDGGIRSDDGDFRAAARRRTVAIRNRLGDIQLVLDGDNYLHALPELGVIVGEVDELMRLALCEFIKDRMAGNRSARKGRDAFEQVVAHALKYWHLPDPRSTGLVSGSTHRRILVVDDDPDIVDYLTHVLRKHDYKVTAAANAEEAMRKVEEDKPNLIILDIMMPKGTEGFHFAWNLRGRSESEYRNIPIIVLTSIHDTTRMRFYPDQSDGYYGPGEYLPVEGFIDKPVGEEELLRQVERVLAHAA